ncbi:MAG: hypothetical protein KC910_07190 [Candidatus Eremiobacteraeota bacterium]|nr:hypothetical protein [Candidatus Eremiobacteraeota bacterium]
MKRRGFSLPEAMLAMVLVFMVLGMVGVLVREYSEATRLAASKEQTLNGVQLGLEQMRSEVGSALALLTPTGGSSNMLSFQRLDPAANRLPPSPAGFTSWDPRPAGQIVTVTYQVGPQGLTRLVAGSGWSAQSQVSEGIRGLETTFLAKDRVGLKVSFQEEHLLRDFSTEARLWVYQP